jgi:phage replication-related protein YjqB (UPF0714/DUF867 family)
LQTRGVNHVSTNVRGGVSYCLTLLESMVRDKPERVEFLKVKVYNSLPSASVYRADEHYLVSVFMHGQLAIDSPQFEISGRGGVLATQFQRELDTLWEIGYPIDLTSWKQSLDLIRP